MVQANEVSRAALYARVSTDDQRDRHTIDAQVTALRGFAPHWGMTIVDEYLDDGVSAEAIERREREQTTAQHAQVAARAERDAAPVPA